MIDRKKVYSMSKLASYEKKYGKKDFKMHKYRRKTFLAVKSLQTAMAVTLAYFLFAVFYMMQFFSEIMKQGFAYHYKRDLLILAAGYLCVLIFFLVISNIHYRKEYNAMLLRVRDYDQKLGRLDSYIQQHEQNKTSLILTDKDEMEA